MVHYKDSFGSTAYKESTTCKEIINTSKPFEDNIKAVWNRNVFFILWYGFIYLYFFIASIINRSIRCIKYIIYFIRKKKYTYIRKVSHNNIIEMHNLIVDSSIWRTIWFMVLFFSIGIAKLIYHTAKISAWIVKRILVPLAIWATAIFAILSISNAIAASNRKES